MADFLHNIRVKGFDNFNDNLRESTNKYCVRDYIIEEELNYKFRRYINITPFNILNIDLLKPITKDKIREYGQLGEFMEKIYDGKKWHPYNSFNKVCYENGDEPDKESGVKCARYIVDDYVFIYQRVNEEYKLVYHFSKLKINEFTESISIGDYTLGIKEIMDAFDSKIGKYYMVID